MKLLEDKIRECGEVYEGGILKVDSFLNHKIDVGLINEMGKEFARLFADLGINKILTVEASGIGIACIVAQYFPGAEVLFAKKNQTKNLDNDTYSANVTSFTHGREYVIRVAKNYLTPSDRVLIIDDFLAAGKATFGLIELIEQAGATLCGVGMCVEKAYQGGGEEIRRRGINLHSLAIVDINDSNDVKFIDDENAAEVFLGK